MSVYTENWTVDKFRRIINKLDEKTGLSGSKLNIILFNSSRRLGYYSHGRVNAFGFNLRFFNNPSTNEAEVVDVIRHEYAHYYDDAARLEKYIVRSSREKSHGADWRWACKMLGAHPKSRHNAQYFRDIAWSVKEIEAKYDAVDVKKLDIRLYLDRWNQIPLDEEKVRKIMTCIKKKNPDGYYEEGDKIVHPYRGYGVVYDAIPIEDEMMQKIYVRFEDLSEGIFKSDELWKIVNGVAVPFCRL